MTASAAAKVRAGAGFDVDVAPQRRQAGGLVAGAAAGVFAGRAGGGAHRQPDVAVVAEGGDETRRDVGRHHRCSEGAAGFLAADGDEFAVPVVEGLEQFDDADGVVAVVLWAVTVRIGGAGL